MKYDFDISEGISICVFADVCQRRDTYEGLKEKQAATPSVSGTFLPYFISKLKTCFIIYCLLVSQVLHVRKIAYHSFLKQKTCLSTHSIAPEVLGFI